MRTRFAFWFSVVAIAHVVVLAVLGVLSGCGAILKRREAKTVLPVELLVEVPPTVEADAPPVVDRPKQEEIPLPP